MNHLPNYQVFLNFLPHTGDEFPLRAEAVGGGVTAMQKLSSLARNLTVKWSLWSNAQDQSLILLISLDVVLRGTNQTVPQQEMENHIEESLRDMSTTIFGLIHFCLKLLGFSGNSWPLRHQYKNEFLLSFLYTALSSWFFFINHDVFFFYSSFQMQSLVVLVIFFSICPH